MKIIPKPRFVSYTSKKFMIPSHFTLSCYSGFLAEAKDFKNLCSIPIDKIETDNSSLNLSTKYNLIIYIADNSTQINKLLSNHNIKFTQEMNDEGYILLVLEHQIILLAKNKAGAFYGLHTLVQLLDQAKDSLQCMVIQDWPLFSFRGISDDISRGQVSTMDNFKQLIDLLAHYKVNIYMPYLEDMYQFKAFPQIGKNRGALSAGECRELQTYAKTKHIQIIPIFQTLGHFENILVQPEFMQYAEYPGSSSLNPVSPKTREFLEILLDEFLPVFDSVYINIGADESWDIGHGASREKANAVGNAQVHADHYKMVFELVKKHNKQIMMYGDIILDYPDILKHIPRNVIIVDWHYDLQAPYASTRLFKKSRNPFLVSPGTQSWSRIFPNLSHAVTNIEGMVRDGAENGAIGVINSAWGDFGGGNIRELNHYLYAFGAEKSWSPDKTDIFKFENTFFTDYYASDDPGIALVYHTLAACSDYYDLNHFFGHPFYMHQRDPDLLLKRATELPHLGKRVESEITRLKTNITKNRDQLDILALCAKMYQWVGALYQLRIDLKREQELPSFNNNLSLLTNQFDLLTESLKEIQSLYQKIWLTYNKKDNLYRILSLMDRVAKLLFIKRQEVLAGDLQLNGQLASQFITSPSDNAEIPVTFLRKSFRLDDIPEKAWVQLIAESHAELWINGNKVGTAVATRTLSAIVEAERVKSWRIEHLLVPGENWIAVKVKQYKKGEKASANIWLETQTPHSIFYSDKTWLAGTIGSENWNQKDADITGWKQAVPVESPWYISRPYFQHGLSSRIEFYRQPPV